MTARRVLSMPSRAALNRNRIGAEHAGEQHPIRQGFDPRRVHYDLSGSVAGERSVIKRFSRRGYMR